MNFNSTLNRTVAKRPAMVDKAEFEKNYPKLNDLWKRVEATDGIKAYLARRPPASF